MIDHRFTRFLLHAALMAIGTIFLLGIAGKKAQAQASPTLPITCLIQGIPKPPVHGTVPFDYTIIASGQSNAPLVEFDVYSSNDDITFINKGRYIYPLYPWQYKGQHAFNEVNQADGGYWWYAKLTDMAGSSSESPTIGQYISP